MKKKLVILTLSALMVIALPVAVSAHGHGSGQVLRINSHVPCESLQVCPTDDCGEYRSQNPGRITSAQPSAHDENENRQECTAESCQETENHVHSQSNAHLNSHENCDGYESHENCDSYESHENHDGHESYENCDGYESHENCDSYESHGHHGRGHN